MADAETRYSPIKKLILALIVTKRKLWYYFEAHRIMVPTFLPHHKSDLYGRIPKWAIQLSPFNIDPGQRRKIKSWQTFSWNSTLKTTCTRCSRAQLCPRLA
ncbi:hypothetical protein QJS10_CPB22g00248 [Acorus calamus]|uniref:Reverse transcriptase RNase H-like domain-containing protein n=1 Tax=Acorus calamus TaxID=4465 RepID=A0AAV9C108_ACOCL|nr:hypothetical protein QJS10_CPB22g00248 [Acorus calamus]